MCMEGGGRGGAAGGRGCRRYRQGSQEEMQGPAVVKFDQCTREALAGHPSSHIMGDKTRPTQNTCG